MNLNTFNFWGFSLLSLIFLIGGFSGYIIERISIVGLFFNLILGMLLLLTASSYVIIDMLQQILNELKGGKK